MFAQYDDGKLCLVRQTFTLCYLQVHDGT